MFMISDQPASAIPTIVGHLVERVLMHAEKAVLVDATTNFAVGEPQATRGEVCWHMVSGLMTTLVVKVTASVDEKNELKLLFQQSPIGGPLTEVRFSPKDVKELLTGQFQVRLLSIFLR